MDNALSVNAFGEYLRQYSQPLTIGTIATFCMISAESPRLAFLPEQYMTSLLWYGAVPLFTMLILGRRSALQLGLSTKAWPLWLKPCALYLAIALPLVALGSSGNQVNTYYLNIQENWGHYLLTTTLYMLGWEYFFRGFLLEGLRPYLKEGAIIMQMVPFTLLHLGKPDIETLSCIASGIVWGYICYHARSFWPALVMHITVNFFTVAWINLL